MGAVIGAIATLTASGIFAQLAVDFIAMSIFVLAIYIIIRAGGWKVGDLGSLLLTIAAGIAFAVMGPYIYPDFVSMFGPIGASSSTGTTLTLLGLASVPGGGTMVNMSPLFVLWALFIGFFLALLAFDRRTPMAAEALAIGIWVLSLLTILANVFGFGGVEWLFPPLTPLTGFSWLWVLSFLYLALGIGLWKQVKLSALAYLILQVFGFLVSLSYGNWLGLILNIALIVYSAGLYWSFKGTL